MRSGENVLLNGEKRNGRTSTIRFNLTSDNHEIDHRHVAFTVVEVEAANGLDNSFWALISFGAWNSFITWGLVMTLP